MSYIKFINSFKKGINRDIKSRKLNLKINIDEFDLLSNKYLKKINDKGLFSKLSIEEMDRQKILFLLRVYFGLWIEIDKNQIKIFKKFPKKFKIIKEVNKSNHYFTPKTFIKNTIMYPVKSAYSLSNDMNGTSLWDTLDPIEGTELVPSVQIDFNYIEKYC
ncbi:MAG: hypothetical protein CMC04_08910 [Flavobacteriaceae bacterium]|jgi:hypothetical protein|nr:hypothetical protein [Flavobacteriaceae bacterium]